MLRACTWQLTITDSVEQFLVQVKLRVDILVSPFSILSITSYSIPVQNYHRYHLLYSMQVQMGRVLVWCAHL